MSLQRKITLSQPNSLKRQQGVVIVVALFIVALTAAIAYYMMSRLDRDIVRTDLLLRHVQAENEVQGSVAWAMDQLRHDWISRKNNRLVDVMPMRSPVNNENDYQIQTIIYDMQARFNLNNLNNTDTQPGFINMVRMLLPNLTSEQALSLVKAISDWIMPGQQQNDYSQYYAAQSPPYRAAHQEVYALGEMEKIKGMPPALLDALQPYVVALPPGAAVNVQTAPAQVLLTLSPAMTIEAAEAIVQARTANPLLTTDDFLKLEVVKNNHITANQMTAVSQYFLVETQVDIEKQHIVIYTLIARTTTDTSANLRILWQSKGIW